MFEMDLGDQPTYLDSVLEAMMESHQRGQVGETTKSDPSGGASDNGNQQQITLEGNNSAFLGSDGNFYMSNGDNATYEDFNSVFSCGDLYSVGINVDNPNGNPSELAEVVDPWPTSSFLPLDTEDINKLQDRNRPSAECNSNSDGAPAPTALGFSNGNFIRLMLHETKPASLTSGGSQAEGTPSNAEASGVETQLTNISNLQDSQECASPAAGVQAGESTPAKIRKPRGRKPKAVKEAEAAAAASALGTVIPNLSQESPSTLAIGRPLNVEDPRPSVTVHHYPDGKMEYRQPLTPRSQISLDQLAQQDRNHTLVRSSAPPPPHPYRPPSAHYRSSNEALTQEYYAARMRSPHDFIRPSSDPNAARVNRLEQFISNRIPPPSNKAVVKPKIIQENKQIYNLLTAPTTHPNTSGLKIAQERWMQYPNPSLVPNEHDPSKQGSPQVQLAGQQHGSSHQHADQSRYMCHLPSRVNVHREADSSRHNSHHRISGSSGYIMANSNIPFHGYDERYDMLKHDMYELRCRNQYLTRCNKQLMYRLRLSYEQNESLKAYLMEHNHFQGSVGSFAQASQAFESGPINRRSVDAIYGKDWLDGGDDGWQSKRSERSVSITGGLGDETLSKEGKIMGEMKRSLSLAEDPYAFKRMKEGGSKLETLKAESVDADTNTKSDDKAEGTNSSGDGINSPGANSVATEVVSVIDDCDNSTSTLFSSPQGASRPMAPPSAPPAQLSFPGFQLHDSSSDTPKTGNFVLVAHTNQVASDKHD